MTVLKQDLFGTVRIAGTDLPHVVRDTTHARWWLRWLARHLARREARALRTLDGLQGVPRLLSADRHRLTREWIEGQPMHRARPTDPRYFRSALILLRRLHRRGVAHNDLAKETNWLVTPAGEPALVDFQLAHCTRKRGAFFRMLAHDDLRHLLKHKRTYLPATLTARERSILAHPSVLARLWMGTGKRVYLFITRRILRWSDREGAGDRTIS
jgi:RIO-like serine/threonine protein kinase